MSSDKLPWFKFFTQDWLATTYDLSLEARGALVTLWALQWERKTLPEDQKKLASLLGIKPAKLKSLWEEIGCDFRSVQGGFQHERLNDLHNEAVDASNRRKHVGKKGAEARWGREGRGADHTVSNADGITDGNPYSNSDGYVDSDPETDPKKKPKTDFLESGRNSIPLAPIEQDIRSRQRNSLVEKHPLPNNWSPSKEIIDGAFRADCELDDLIQAFRAWATGKASSNWDEAFLTFTKRHRPSDEQLQRAKAADRDVAKRFMDGLSKRFQGPVMPGSMVDSSG